MCTPQPHRVLFLCVANSARSQMAEGLARSLNLPGVLFFSAGSDPTEVNPHASAVMAELGLSLSEHESKHVDTLRHLNFDTVITLCKEEYCPSYLGNARRLHWPFEDPGDRGDESSTRESFRHARDMIDRRLREYYLAPPTQSADHH